MSHNTASPPPYSSTTIPPPNHQSSHKRKRDIAFASNRIDSHKEERSVKRCVHRDDDIRIDGRKLVFEDYIGRGEYGNVYLARLGPQKLAVKFFRESARQLFLNECQCLIRVRHTSHRIVNLVGFGSIPNSKEMFMAFEYIGELDLRSLIRNYPESEVPLIKKVEIMLELLYALGEIHNAGITHHDLKPNNVLLSDGALKPIICDFGMASFQHCAFREQPKGTLHYMAPEGHQASLERLTHHSNSVAATAEGQRQSRKDKLAEQRSNSQMCFSSDIWSLGVLFYELLTHGMLPYEGRKNSDDFSHQLMEEEPTPFPHRLGKTIPPAWHHVIFNMMLVRDPKKRATVHSIINYLNSQNVTLLSVAATHQKALNKMRETLSEKEKDLVESHDKQFRIAGYTSSSSSNSEASLRDYSGRSNRHQEHMEHHHYSRQYAQQHAKDTEFAATSRYQKERATHHHQHRQYSQQHTSTPQYQQKTSARQSHLLTLDELLDSFHDDEQSTSRLQSSVDFSSMQQEQHDGRISTRRIKGGEYHTHRAAFGSHDEPPNLIGRTRRTTESSTTTSGLHARQHAAAPHRERRGGTSSGSTSVETPTEDSIDDLIIHSLIQQGSSLGVV